jgi:hypothetical protein
MKWPSVLRAHRARTFQRNAAFENLRIDGNRFIVSARAHGENDFASRHIRNSISLTMWRTRRMICASHQRGMTAPLERISLNAAPHGTCAT